MSFSRSEGLSVLETEVLFIHRPGMDAKRHCANMSVSNHTVGLREQHC